MVLGVLGSLAASSVYRFLVGSVAARAMRPE